MECALASINSRYHWFFAQRRTQPDYCFLAEGNISIHDDRCYTKPWGVHGGGVGSRSKKTLVRYSLDATNPPREILSSKADFIKASTLTLTLARFL